MQLTTHAKGLGSYALLLGRYSNIKFQYYRTNKTMDVGILMELTIVLDTSPAPRNVASS